MNNGLSNNEITSDDLQLVDEIISINHSDLDRTKQYCRCCIQCLSKFTFTSWVYHITTSCWKKQNNACYFVDTYIAEQINENNNFYGAQNIIVPIIEVLPDDQIITGLHDLNDIDPTSTNCRAPHPDTIIINNNHDKLDQLEPNVNKKYTTKCEDDVNPDNVTEIYINDDINDDIPTSDINLFPDTGIQKGQNKITEPAHMITESAITESAITESVITESAIIQAESNDSDPHVLPIKRLRSKSDPVPEQKSSSKALQALQSPVIMRISIDSPSSYPVAVPSSPPSAISSSPRLSESLSSNELDEKYRAIYENLKVIRSIKPNDKLRVSSIGDLSIEQSFIPSLFRALSGNNKIVTVNRIDETIKVAKQLRKNSQIKQLMDEQLATGLRNLAVTYKNDDIFKEKLESLASSF